MHSRTPYMQRNMGSSYWRGGTMREGASKRNGSIFCCYHERRSCCWTFATKDIQTVFALFPTRRYHWLCYDRSEKILDLPQGGLEVPCSMLLKAKLKEIEKFKKLHTFSSVVLNNSLFKNCRSRKIFVFLIFEFLEVSENIFTPKISGFTVNQPCQLIQAHLCLPQKLIWITSIGPVMG